MLREGFPHLHSLLRQRSRQINARHHRMDGNSPKYSQVHCTVCSTPYSVPFALAPTREDFTTMCTMWGAWPLKVLHHR